MYDHIDLKVKDVPASARFYQAALAPLGHVLASQDDAGAGLGPDGAPALWLYRAAQAQSPLPVINVLHALDAAIAARRLASVGLIGTRMVMDTRAYGAITAAQVLLPDEPEREAAHRAYVEMAVPGRVTPTQREVFFEAGRALTARGAEAIVLGGTDLFLAFEGADGGFATLDCARVHVEAILARAFGAS